MSSQLPQFLAMLHHPIELCVYVYVARRHAFQQQLSGSAYTLSPIRQTKRWIRQNKMQIHMHTCICCVRVRVARDYKNDVRFIQYIFMSIPVKCRSHVQLNYYKLHRACNHTIFLFATSASRGGIHNDFWLRKIPFHIYIYDH